jgi:[protein-PII] uridylyltransferase
MTSQTHHTGGPAEERSGAAGTFRDAKTALIGQTLELGRSPSEFFPSYSRLTDEYFRHRLVELGREVDRSFAVVAIGGYGRGELCLHSDIDILLLWKGRVPEWAGQASRELFFPLWDLGLELGYAVRDLKGCIRLAGEDHQVLTSLLSARLIGGDPAPFAAMQERIGETIRGKRNRFLRWLQDQNRGRAERFGDAAALVEPELKNGIGGLRDYHQVLWMRRFEEEHTGSPFPYPFTILELEDIGRRAAYLLRARNALHFLSGRRNDKLHLELQQKAASFFEAGESEEGVEGFLGRLHRDMSRIKLLRGALSRYCTTELRGRTRPAGEGILSGPDGLRLSESSLPGAPVLLSLFENSAKTGVPLSWSAMRQAEDAPIAGGDVTDRRILGSLVSILSAPHGPDALEQMLESGFLGRLIPEFGRVQDMVQFDAYHMHPVGRHSVETVRRLHEIAAAPGGILEEIWRRIAKRELVLLAAILHDIGKNGKDHESRGAAIAGELLAMLGLDSAAVQEVVFLVGRHLLLFKTATRKDLGDEAAVAACAEKVGLPERLDMLMLLSVADARATGPKAWNDWVASLLSELYFKLRNFLTRSALSGPDAWARMSGTREQVLGIGAGLERARLERELEGMPPRYLLAMTPGEIVEHLGLIDVLEECIAEERLRVPGGRAGKGTVALSSRRIEEQGCHELTVAAEDQPGLFSTICGVLALYDLNILSAEIFTFSGGKAVGIFKVRNLLDDMDEEELFARVRRGVKHALNGKLSLEYRLDQKRSSPLSRQPMRTGTPPRVSIDEKATDFFTLVEILADDRLGRLHDIAITFDSLGVRVHIAKVATHGDRIADTFYVRDALGQKLTALQSKELEEALLTSLSVKPSPCERLN